MSDKEHLFTYNVKYQVTAKNAVEALEKLHTFSPLRDLHIELSAIVDEGPI